MAVTITERKVSTRSLSGTSAKREYVIKGATSETQALTSLLTASVAIVPATVNGFPASKSEWSVDELAPGIYAGTATWKQDQAEAKKNQAPSTFRFSFDISGQSTRILFSRKNVANYCIGTDQTKAPKFKQAVGVGADGTIEGADILKPVMTWTAAFRVNATLVTSTYIAGLANCVGTINQSAWNGFTEEVLLLTGVSGDKSFYTPDTGAAGYWVYDLTFKFAVQPDEADIEIGEIKKFNKKGWQYVWVHFEQVKDTTAQKMVSRPLSAHVEDLYPKKNYASLLGFGS